MHSAFWYPERLKAFGAEIATLAERLEVTRYVSVRIRFSVGESSVVIVIDAGRIEIVPDPVLEADVTVAGPRSEWERVETGELDWIQATTPGLGVITVEGDTVFVMRNVAIFWSLFSAIARTGPKPKAVVFSPAAPAPDFNTVGKYVDVDGLAIYYEEAGQGPPILCLHAACQDTLMYRHVLAGLSDQYRVVAVDAPGHGKSPMAASGPLLDLQSHARFTERFIDILGLVRPVILGCSMAGNEVLAMAARRPGAYAAVISSEGADCTVRDHSFTRDLMMINGHQLLEYFATSLTGPRTPPDRARDVLWQLRRATPEIMAADLVAYQTFDEREQMGRIVDPVLLLRGTADWLVSQEQVDATASRITTSTVAVLEGTGHYPMIENPTEFNGAVRSYLQSLGIGGNSGSNAD